MPRTTKVVTSGASPSGTDCHADRRQGDPHGGRPHDPLRTHAAENNGGLTVTAPARVQHGLLAGRGCCFRCRAR